MALEVAPTDPLVQYELGVLFYEKGFYQKAIGHFKVVLKLLAETKQSSKLWNSTLCNLGHCHRRFL